MAAAPRTPRRRRTRSTQRDVEWSAVLSADAPGSGRAALQDPLRGRARRRRGRPRRVLREPVNSLVTRRATRRDAIGGGTSGASLRFFPIIAALFCGVHIN